MGIPAARPVPREELPDQRQSVGGQRRRRLRRFESRCRRGRQAIPSPCPTSTTQLDRACGSLAIQLEVTLTTERMRRRASRRTCFRAARPTAAMYWSAAQIVAHHTSNGCNLQPGDLIGTGTLSTDERRRSRVASRDQPRRQAAGRACDRRSRSFLEDGDEITLRAWCEAEGAARDRFRRVRRAGGRRPS